MRRAALVLAVASCNPTHNPVTPPGTVILDWDVTKATRVGVKTATVGPKTPKDYSVVVTHEGAPPITYALHLELAPIDYEEAGRHAHHTTAVAIKLTVKDNTGWDISAECNTGPDYQFGDVDDAGHMDVPLAMLERCLTHEHRYAGRLITSAWQVGTWLEIFGDGKVDVIGSHDEVKITPT